jgi:hypothetical protein
VSRANQPLERLASTLGRRGDPVLVAPLQMEDGTGHRRHRLHEVDGHRIERRTRQPLERDGAGHAAAIPDPDRANRGAALLPRQFGMRVRYRRIRSRARRPHYRDTLIRSFIHRALRGANHIRPLVDGAAVRHRVDLRPALPDQPDAHAIAGQSRRRRRGERRCRTKKPVVLERARHELQRRLETQARALVAVQIDAQRRDAVHEHLEPAGAPLKLAKYRRHVDSVSHGDVQCDDAMQPAVYLNREPNVDPVLDNAGSRHFARATKHEAPPLGERSFGNLCEMLNRLSLGPHRNRDKAT